MKSWRPVWVMLVTIVVTLAAVAIYDQTRPSCVDAQTCIPVFNRTQQVGGGVGCGGSTASCPVGMFVTGGGCDCVDTDAQVVDTRPAGNGWFCSCKDVESDDCRSGAATAICIGN